MKKKGNKKWEAKLVRQTGQLRDTGHPLCGAEYSAPLFYQFFFVKSKVLQLLTRWQLATDGSTAYRLQ